MKPTPEQIKSLIIEGAYISHWRECPIEDYHNDKTAVNYSALKHMDKSRHAFARCFWGENKEPTDAMKFGSLAHKAILEGETFNKNYVVVPEFVGLTKDGRPSTQSAEAKQKRLDFLKDLPPTAIIVTEEERDKLFYMIDSIMSNKKAALLLSKGKSEVIGYWKDPSTGINMRMAADFISFDLGVLVDVKTCKDIRWDFFRKNVENYNYGLQMAFYSEGIKHITGKEPTSRAWIAIESEEPYECRIHEVSPIYDEIGRFEYRRLLDELKLAIDENDFSQKNEEIMIGEPSLWFKKKYEDLGILETI